MFCPRCGQAQPAAAPQCAACGFHVGEAQRLLGSSVVNVERLIDHAHCLSLRDAHYLKLALDEFERRFPQTFISVFLGSLPANVNAPQAAFWLLNHCAAARNDQVKPAHWGIVLVLDLHQKQAGLSLGYSLEPLVAGATEILQKALPHFAHGEHARGIHVVLKELQNQLKNAGRHQRRQPPTAGNQEQSHLGLEPVRTRTRLAGTLPPKRTQAGE